MEQILSFLYDLNRNNEREWFHANKVRYQESKDSFLALVEQVINELVSTDLRIHELNPKDCVFRINRDVRFSRDKSPYKTYFGAYMANGGRKSSNAGYYLHIAWDEIFIGAGVYHPEKEELNAIRQEIIYQPEKFSSILNTIVKKGFSLMEEDKLKKGPIGFDKNSPYIDLVKYKSYILSRKISKKEILAPGISITVANYFKEIFPLTEFLNTAMEFKGND